MKKWVFPLLLALLLNGFACARAEEKDEWAALSDAYAYAFPLVLMDATETAAQKPVNQLIHSQRLADASTKLVVTPNVDTVYTQAWLDLSGGPVLFTMPETERYCTAQVLDAWTNTVVMLDQAGTYAFAPPTWTGELPEGVTRVELPTSMGWMIARVVLDGEADMDAVRAIQAGMAMARLDGETSAQPEPVEAFVPVERVLTMSMQAFFDAANRLMLDNPPAEADAEALEAFAALNVGPGLNFDAEALPGDRAAKWTEMLTNLRATLVKAGARYAVQLGQWRYFGAPIGDFGTAYDYRAMVALGGLGANRVQDAIYAKVILDAGTYTLHFRSLPPMLDGGFWSVTVYGADDFLIDNPLNRYCLNDRSECAMNEDGSLDILLSAEAPEDTTNWLPVNGGQLQVYLRVYRPDMQALEAWEAPTIS